MVGGVTLKKNVISQAKIILSVVQLVSVDGIIG